MNDPKTAKRSDYEISMKEGDKVMINIMEGEKVLNKIQYRLQNGRLVATYDRKAMNDTLKWLKDKAHDMTETLSGR